MTPHLSEFDLIARYFTRPGHPAPTNSITTLGIGDDCALLSPPAGQQLAISSDMLVAGRHFFPDADPYSLGHKCLAVNLSDLAAMGAQPLGFTLALALPHIDADWLAAFSAGLFTLADAHHCELIGGDTTRGPLTICITIFGALPPPGLRRDRAQTGDDIWVSGTLGDARLSLAHYLGEITLDRAAQDAAAARPHQPTPRIGLGLALRDCARAAIDISDGLLGDLEHILQRSQVGATIDVDALPVGPMLRGQTSPLQRQFALTGGDDYELCFTASPTRCSEILAAATANSTPVTRIGRIETLPGLRVVDRHGAIVDLPFHAFDHFLSP